ncbi:lamin tail domain-containing protein [Haloprofundus salilacus]|uniref:lamin tail domain-containing protein n=1 Tax=Haloprofundus salilacus TaxID=2876190 RepID=UPI001CCF9480|nr:lamin tail domain-containing protein [Haloprofundus salilacus]
MKRRALLTLSGTVLTGLAGCSETLSFDSSRSAEAVTVKQPGCSPYEADRIVTPSEETLVVHYDVSGSLSGDFDQWEETITLQNTGDLPIELTDYTIQFETGQDFTFDGLTLIPSASVILVTFGNPGIPTTTTCPKYDYVRQVGLVEPLLQDRTTRVSVLAPDGDHLFRKQIELEG